MKFHLSLCRVLFFVLCVCSIVPTECSDMSKYNIRVGKKYLEENGKKEGVTSLSSGLQYKILKSGTGTISPKQTETVKVNYEGKLINGEIFDSSYQRGTPSSFSPSGVIKCWTEALLIMHEGDEWEITCPSDIAYGATGSPPKIGPHSVLVFRVELIEIEGEGKGKGKGKPPRPGPGPRGKHPKPPPRPNHKAPPRKQEL